MSTEQTFTEHVFFQNQANPLRTRFFEGDAVALKRWVYLPSGERPERGWPVVLFLHGDGEKATHPSGRRPPESGMGPALRAHPERFPCIVVFPQCDSYWDDTARDKALRALDVTLEAIQQQYPHDPNRIYLTGLSFGGFGAWKLAAEHRPKFAALMLMCPWPRSLAEVPQALKNPPNLKGMPVRVFQGGNDTAVRPLDRVNNTNEMVAVLRAQGMPSENYSLLPGVGHNCWDAAYGDQQAIQWFLEQRRA